MRILFIAMIDSIHTARWIRQLYETDFDIHVFPSMEGSRPHRSLVSKRIRIYAPPISLMYFKRKTRAVINGLSEIVPRIFRRNAGKKHNPLKEKKLAKTIKKIKPDIIHSLETQHAGYLVYSTKKLFFNGIQFPLWLHTNWGSDIYLFGKLREHRDRIREVMTECNYYSCESERDIGLARNFGFTGKTFDPFPNTGGFNIREAFLLRGRSKASARKSILLKGYQGWAGRALFGLKALEMAKLHLGGYTIKIFGNPKGMDVKIAAELFTHHTSIPAEILPYTYNHEEMLGHFAESRIYIGLSISDSISTSLLEAMAMGAFPIQSDTSTASEWIEDGVSGFIVPPEDPAVIAERITQALMSDDLVDKAAEKNWSTIVDRVDEDKLKSQTMAIYERIASDHGLRNGGRRMRRIGKWAWKKAANILRKARAWMGRKPRLETDVGKRFTKFFKWNVFRSEESRSGTGSTLDQTRVIRRELPKLLAELHAQSMIDAPCGDFHWMSVTALGIKSYLGLDIVEELIKRNNELYASAERSFARLNIIEDELPCADLVLCRDCLVHLTFKEGIAAIRNFKKSGGNYLLMTTFTEREKNEDLAPGDIWRTLNMCLPPFSFPKPLSLINEGCTEAEGRFADKSLGLWRLADICL